MEKVLQKQNGLMFGIYKRSGFTLIEILLALVILAIIIAVAVPNFQGLLPSYQREQFLKRFNSLVQSGWQRAIKTRTIHKVTLDVAGKKIRLEAATGQTDAKGEIIYLPVQESALSSQATIPDGFDIKQLFVEGFDEMSRYVGNRKTAKIWFFMMPDGIAQNVIINAFDTNQLINNKPKVVSLVLNPFYAQFSVYDEFQKP